MTMSEPRQVSNRDDDMVQSPHLRHRADRFVGGLYFRVLRPAARASYTTRPVGLISRRKDPAL